MYNCKVLYTYTPLLLLLDCIAFKMITLLDHTLTQFNLISDAFTQVTILCTLHNTTRLEPICNKCLGELPPTRSPWRSEQSGRAASATFNGVPGQCVGSLAAKSAIHTTCSLTAETTQLFSLPGGGAGCFTGASGCPVSCRGKRSKKKKKEKRKKPLIIYASGSLNPLYCD